MVRWVRSGNNIRILFAFTDNCYIYNFNVFAAHKNEVDAIVMIFGIVR